MPIRRSLSLALILPLASPLAARVDDLAGLARAYVAERGAESFGVLHLGVPSFSRQTGLACSACHYQFLSLTPFGRAFKLNGYTLTAQTTIQERDPANGATLKLSPIPLVSGMLQSSLTHLSDDVPGVQNSSVALPQQLSVFVAGELSSRIGLFSQITYAGENGTIGVDNIDLRFARPAGGAGLVYGLTLNNNPSVSDLWNTTPVWGWPYASSAAGVAPLAGTVIDGALAQQSLGLGAYTMVRDLVYAEFDVYRSAEQGKVAPDTASANTVSGVAPYWRVALQKEWGRTYAMVGTYGLRTKLLPAGVTGPGNTFTDVAVDAQVEERVGHGTLIGRGTYIHEKQRLEATFPDGGSSNAENTLRTLRLNSTYAPHPWLGLTAGYFQTSGTPDPTLYPAAPVEGSVTGSPKTNGFIGELDVNPWQNTRLGVQYVAYDRFNGRGNNYDGAGRDASGNDQLYLLAWVVF
jgi:hypothetical protein